MPGLFTVVQPVMVAVKPAPVGVSITWPPSVSGVFLPVLKPVSAEVRSLSSGRSAGVLPVKAIVPVSCGAAPSAMPNSHTVADHLPASVPEVILVNVSATSDGEPCAPLSMSSDPATPESVPVMLSILSVVPPVGSKFMLGLITERDGRTITAEVRREIVESYLIGGIKMSQLSKT